ncbi:MAG: NmrA family NAD(P)-binding protein [Saprospiraceae bacterium]|nr:NmrA family NAD(P)-binding protein [Saprospiraceae bacterium]
MSIPSLKVLVYGGTGSQASQTVLKLLEKGHTPFVLTRDPKKAEALSSKGAKIVVGNTGNVESLIQASEGIDAVALMTPLFSEVLPKIAAENAITAAKAANVKLIVWNTSGKTPEQPLGNPQHSEEKLVIIGCRHPSLQEY